VIASDLSYRYFVSPLGFDVQLGVRESTIDYDLGMSTIYDDEYAIGSEGVLEGWALDIGTSIAPVAIALAKANPKLRVLALDVVPENIELAQHNVELNNVGDRVTVLQRAMGGPDEASRTCYMRHKSHPAVTDGYAAKHRYIANTLWNPEHSADSEVVNMPVTNLGALLDEFGIDEVAFLKIDCEGCEWAVLDSPAVSRVKYIIGEYHWDYIGQRNESILRPGTKVPQWAATPQQELERLLGKTHDLELGAAPTLGLFRAWRRRA
jgi:FkbM family methyltransferase